MSNEYLNYNIENISEYPFSRLRSLLSKIKINNRNEEVLDLSIGQPYHKFPKFVKNMLTKESMKWNCILRLMVFQCLRTSYLNWLKRDTILKTFFGEENIIPLSGTREGLFSISLVLLVKQIIVPNPFYQVYLGASLFQNLPMVMMNAGIDESYLIRFR